MALRLHFVTTVYVDCMGTQMGRTTDFYGETTYFYRKNLLRGTTKGPSGVCQTIFLMSGSYLSIWARRKPKLPSSCMALFGQTM